MKEVLETMENILSYTSVQIKTRFSPPSKLVCNNELAVCIGCIYARRKQALPEIPDDIGILAEPFRKEDAEAEKDEKIRKLLLMIQGYLVKPSDDYWKDILKESYEHGSK